MKLIATRAGSLSVEPAVGSSGIGGLASILDIGSSSVKIEGSPVMMSPLVFTIIGVTAPGGYVQPAPLVGTIQATATKTKVEGSLVLREDDQATVNIPLIQIPSGTPTTVSMIVRVSDTGQITTRAA